MDCIPQKKIGQEIACNISVSGTIKLHCVLLNHKQASRNIVFISKAEVINENIISMVYKVLLQLRQ